MVCSQVLPDSGVSCHKPCPPSGTREKTEQSWPSFIQYVSPATKRVPLASKLTLTGLVMLLETVDREYAPSERVSSTTVKLELVTAMSPLLSSASPTGYCQPASIAD